MRAALVATSIVIASCATAPTPPSPSPSSPSPSSPSSSASSPALVGPRVRGNGFSVTNPDGFVVRAADPGRPTPLELDHAEADGANDAAVVLYADGPMAYPGALDDARCHELSGLVIRAEI